MRSIVLWYSLTMLLVGAIAAVAVLWCHLNHVHRYQGAVLVSLTDRHGVHVFDIVVLAVELALLLILSAILVAGFHRPR
jgi:hypothetical protein